MNFLILLAAAATIGNVPQKRVDRQINEDVRRMMTALFSILESELNNFISSFEKLDSLYVEFILMQILKMVKKITNEKIHFPAIRCMYWCD